MATKKKAAKPAKKPSAPKKVAKPAIKKAVIAKKSAKPAHAPKKVVKPVIAKKSPMPTPPKKVASKPAAVPVKPVVPAKPVAPVVAKKGEIKKIVAPTTRADNKPTEAKPLIIGEKKFKPVVPPPPPRKPVVPTKPTKVVMPEIKTKTVRKYEPEFTKSVLDQPENIQTGPTMRYSDAELVEFKDLILKKLEQAKKELTYLQGLITRRDEMGGDENENRYMTMEDGSMSMEREQLAQMASRQINYTDHLEKALMRIENKTYGICRVTGKLIDKARLRAVPHATLSIEAKQMMNK
jgi:RNA polymerase-binding transcription factor DksA